MNKPESVILYFKQGSSDKQYMVHLEEGRNSKTNDIGWTVDFAYGRRGGPQTQGTKTKEPVPYEKAKGIYDKLIHTKQLKGYTISGSAPAFADNSNAGKQTNFQPQLLNEVTLEEAEQFYWDNVDNIALQIKWDGERRGLFMTHTDIIPANRNGLVTTVSEPIMTALRALVPKDSDLLTKVEFDCEDMGKYLMIFDILQVSDVNMKEQSFRDRADYMRFLQVGIDTNNLRSALKVEHPFYPANILEFKAFIETARKHNEEGVVIRKASAIYEPGRPNSGGNCLKYKFLGSATCQVIGQVEGKRSVYIGVRNPLGAIAPIGKVTIYPDQEIPENGDFIEITYLNILKGEGAKLFQPRYKTPRPDKTEADFHSSLKFKKED